MCSTSSLITPSCTSESLGISVSTAQSTSALSYAPSYAAPSSSVTSWTIPYLPPQSLPSFASQSSAVSLTPLSSETPSYAVPSQSVVYGYPVAYFSAAASSSGASVLVVTTWSSVPRSGAAPPTSTSLGSSNLSTPVYNTIVAASSAFSIYYSISSSSGIPSSFAFPPLAYVPSLPPASSTQSTSSVGAPTLSVPLETFRYSPPSSTKEPISSAVSTSPGSTYVPAFSSTLSSDYIPPPIFGNYGQPPPITSSQKPKHTQPSYGSGGYGGSYGFGP